LSALTNALYRKEPRRDASALDEAVRHAIAVAKDVAAERSSLRTLLRQGYGGQAR